jgi:hypothetical protein
VQNDPNLSLDLLEALKESENLNMEIRKAYDLGDACLKQARWIGVNRYMGFILHFSIAIMLNCNFQIQ